MCLLYKICEQYQVDRRQRELLIKLIIREVRSKAEFNSKSTARLSDKKVKN